ncbi:hypothetical protein PUN4_230019 [Paraburkholderia unamae]|nr:hypothetical protein PUN4_230019 [Paraburkholderia unamae]
MLVRWRSRPKFETEPAGGRSLAGRDGMNTALSSGKWSRLRASRTERQSSGRFCRRCRDKLGRGRFCRQRLQNPFSRQGKINDAHLRKILPAETAAELSGEVGAHTPDQRLAVRGPDRALPPHLHAY